MATKIQIRRGLSTDWTSVNPLLAQGEMGLETDTNLFKFGDGSTLWIYLPYVTSGSGSGTSGTSGTSGIDGSNGSSGTSGLNGSSGTSGLNGSSGSSGTSGLGFTPQTIGQSFATDGSILGSNINFYVADYGAFSIGNFINIVDQSSGSTFYYTGKITLIQFAGGFGWAIHMDVLGYAGTPISSTSNSWLMELTGSIGLSGSSGTSGVSGGGGDASLRFITSSITLAAGSEHIFYDAFVFATYSISTYDTSYDIAGSTFYNNAMVSIIDKLWIDSVLDIGGELNIGI